MRKDRVLIVGLPRSGTTTLLRNVEKLLDIEEKTVEEFGFWPKVLRIRTKNAIDSFIDNSPNISQLFAKSDIANLKEVNFFKKYLGLLDIIYFEEAVSVDKTPCTFEIIDLLCKLHNFKVIVIRRRPEDRLVSALASQDVEFEILSGAFRFGVQEQMNHVFEKNIRRLNKNTVCEIDYNDVKNEDYTKLSTFLGIEYKHNGNLVENTLYGYSSAKHKAYDYAKRFVDGNLHQTTMTSRLCCFLGKFAYTVRVYYRRYLFRLYCCLT